MLSSFPTTSSSIFPHKLVIISWATLCLPSLPTSTTSPWTESFGDSILVIWGFGISRLGTRIKLVYTIIINNYVFVNISNYVPSDWWAKLYSDINNTLNPLDNDRHLLIQLLFTIIKSAEQVTCTLSRLEETLWLQLT